MSPDLGDQAVQRALMQVTDSVFLLNSEGRIAVGRGGAVRMGNHAKPESMECPVYAYIPALHPENLGSARFKNLTIFVMLTLPVQWQTASHPLKWLKKWDEPG